LSQFPEFAADIAAAPAGPPPATPTPPTQFVPAAPVSESEAGRTGLPWENRAERGFFNAFIETLQMVLTKPDLAFRTMKVEGGLADPVSYALIGGVVGGVIAFLYSFVFQSMGFFTERRNA